MGRSPQKDFRHPDSAPPKPSGPVTRPTAPPAAARRATRAIAPTTDPFRTFARITLYPIRARAPKATSNRPRTHETPSTRSTTTAATKATAPAKTASAPPRTIGSWYAGIRPSARHVDAARAGHDRIAAAAMLFQLERSQRRGYLTVLGRSSNLSNSL